MNAYHNRMSNAQPEASWTKYRRYNLRYAQSKSVQTGKRLVAFCYIFFAGVFILSFLAFSTNFYEITFEENTSENQSTPQSEWQQGIMPHLYQTDAQWSNHLYAGSVFKESGCGPISLAMVYIFLTGDQTTSPTEIADMAEGLGFANADGTSWEFMKAGAWKLGLQAEEATLDEGYVVRQLNAGHPIICIMGQGDFTTTGHFIVISSITTDGLLYIHDPNSPERSSRLWSLETIQKQYKNAWVYSREAVAGRPSMHL